MTSTALWILLAAVVVQRQGIVRGFGNQAGGCAGGLGTSAIGGPHSFLNRNPVTGGLFGRLTVTLDGIPLMAAGVGEVTLPAMSVVTVGELHTLELTAEAGSEFRGVLFRLEQEGRALSVANLFPDQTDPNLQDAVVCQSPIVGVCHNSNSLKSTAKASLFLDAETSLPPTTLTLDVTVVVSNNSTSSVYYYDGFQLDPVTTTTLPPGIIQQPGETCSLCPPGVPLINADLVFPESDGTTCADVASLAPQLPDESCKEVQQALAPVCCAGIANCTMCADDVPPANPGAAIPYQEVGFDCVTLRLAVYYGYAFETCLTLSSLEQETGLDGGGYCGCPELAGTESNICSPTLCPLDTGFNADLFIPAANVTCGTLQASLPWLTTQEACSIALDVAIAAGCCLSTGTTLPPAPAPTQSPDPPTTTAECNLCGDGSTMGNRDASLGPVVQGITCGFAQMGADRGEFDADLCPLFQFLARKDDACGCTGTYTPPPDACQLCGGDPTALINAEESFDDEIDFTCADFAELATYYRTGDEACADTLEAGAPACCVGVANCTFCAGDAVPSNPDAVVPYYDTYTCREMRFEAYYAYDPPIQDGGEGTGCFLVDDALLATGIDVVAYCGCPEGEPPADLPTCGLCPPDKTVAGELFVDAANATCSDLEAAVPYFVDASLCQNVAIDGQFGGCCMEMTETPTATPNATSAAPGNSTAPPAIDATAPPATGTAPPAVDATTSPVIDATATAPLTVHATTPPANGTVPPVNGTALPVNGTAPPESPINRTSAPTAASTNGTVAVTTTTAPEQAPTTTEAPTLAPATIAPTPNATQQAEANTESTRSAPASSAWVASPTGGGSPLVSLAVAMTLLSSLLPSW